MSKNLENGIFGSWRFSTLDRISKEKLQTPLGIYSIALSVQFRNISKLKPSNYSGYFAPSFTCKVVINLMNSHFLKIPTLRFSKKFCSRIFSVQNSLLPILQKTTRKQQNYHFWCHWWLHWRSMGKPFRWRISSLATNLQAKRSTKSRQANVEETLADFEKSKPTASKKGNEVYGETRCLFAQFWDCGWNCQWCGKHIHQYCNCLEIPVRFRGIHVFGYLALLYTVS